MRYLLVTKKSVWLPTPIGWASALLLLVLPGVTWFFCGEAFLTQTRRVPASTLVVEGWIGYEGMAAAAAEFQQGNYDYIISAGGPTDDTWSRHRWSYAKMGRDELEQNGVPKEVILLADVPEMNRHRTFETARAAFSSILEKRGKAPAAVTVFTHGMHARRSRLVFQRVFGSDTEVGVIAWIPTREHAGSWWNSSSRGSDFLKESIAYPLELIFHSFRS